MSRRPIGIDGEPLPDTWPWAPTGPDGLTYIERCLRRPLPAPEPCVTCGGPISTERQIEAGMRWWPVTTCSRACARRAPARPPSKTAAEQTPRRDP